MSFYVVPNIVQHYLHWIEGVKMLAKKVILLSSVNTIRGQMEVLALALKH